MSPVPGPGSAATRRTAPATRIAASCGRNTSGWSVNATVPIVRASAGVYVELLADAVDLPLQVAVLDLGPRVNAPALQEEISDGETAEVRRVGYTARIAKRREQRDRAHDRDADFRGHPEDDHQNRALWKVHRV